MPRTSLANAFRHHPPKGNQAPRYEAIRAHGGRFAEVLTRLCPEGEERDAAILKIREAVMMANAAIACGEAGATHPGVVQHNPDDFAL